ncbi:recombinase family protein [Stackebrandtia soli]|uniref:recombinase family protein n=1 Tax=Stackebrandtia soli TaxID=1892856 RepID=UPI0039EBF2D6
MQRRSRLPANHIPQAAILYCRISDSRDEDGESTTGGVDDQERRLRLHFEALLGWGVHMVLVENDTSAFKRRRIMLPGGGSGLRVVRPKFRKALGWLDDGTCDGFATVDLDRGMRDPRDLEDMIDLVEMYRIPVKSLTGSLQLDTDAGITMARVMVAVANKSSRDTARRLRDNREARALAGQWGGGKRPFGFEPDGITLRPAEAELILAGTRDLLAQVSLSDQVRALEEGGVPTVGGKPWTIQSWRQILLRPRNAGLLVHRGEVIGDAPWKPIVSRELWEAGCAALAERRRPSVNNSHAYLGSGIYVCGLCGAPFGSGARGSSEIVNGEKRFRPGYRCSATSHMSRDAIHLDEYVENVLLARCIRADAASLLLPAAPDINAEAIKTTIATLRATMQEMSRDRALGLIERSEHLDGRAVAKAEIDRLSATLRSALVDSPAAELIGAEDVLAAWEDMPMSRRRPVVRSVMTVVVHPLPRQRRARGEFTAGAVQILWRPAPPGRRGVAPDVWPPPWLPAHDG